MIARRTLVVCVQILDLCTILYLGIVANLLVNTMTDRGWRAIHQPKNLSFWEYSHSIWDRVAPMCWISCVLCAANLLFLIVFLRERPGKGVIAFQSLITVINGCSLLLFFAMFMMLYGA